MERKETNNVQAHIVNKFEKFANSRQITIVGTPTVCTVSFFGNRKKQQHMAVHATDAKGNKGFVINRGGKKLVFLPASRANAVPLKNDRMVECGHVKGKRPKLIKNRNGISFAVTAA